MSAPSDHPPASSVKAARKQNDACPICEKPSVVSYRPFCSKRCADIDLGRWLTESYRLPG